jgi:hypothetical protein
VAIDASQQETITRTVAIIAGRGTVRLIAVVSS